MRFVLVAFETDAIAEDETVSSSTLSCAIPSPDLRPRLRSVLHPCGLPLHSCSTDNERVGASTYARSMVCFVFRFRGGTSCILGRPVTGGVCRSSSWPRDACSSAVPGRALLSRPPGRALPVPRPRAHRTPTTTRTTPRSPATSASARRVRSHARTCMSALTYMDCAATSRIAAQQVAACGSRRGKSQVGTMSGARAMDAHDDHAMRMPAPAFERRRHGTDTGSTRGSGASWRHRL